MRMSMSISELRTPLSHATPPPAIEVAEATLDAPEPVSEGAPRGGGLAQRILHCHSCRH